MTDRGSFETAVAPGGTRRALQPRRSATVVLLSPLLLLATVSVAGAEKPLLRLDVEPRPAVFEPLDPVPVRADVAGTLSVLDARGREYARLPAEGRATFRAGGAAGLQSIRLLDAEGAVLASLSFQLAPRTRVSESTGRTEALLEMLEASMASWEGSMPKGIGTLEWRERTHRYLGAFERAQVSLSNSYSLNRGITHEQAAAIIRTYRAIRDALPPSSPGEWYGIYPPFERGFSGHSEPWQYVNGGVSPIIAGELARGAFVHGFESYAADVLSRVQELGERHGGRVRFAYTGAYPLVPEPRFTTVDLAAHANMDLAGEGAPGVPGWMATMPDDHMASLPTGMQAFAGVPFLVTDPATNGRRAAVAVSRREGLPERVEVPVGTKTGSIYVLHTTGDNGNTKLAGALTFLYEDGTDATPSTSCATATSPTGGTRTSTARGPRGTDSLACLLS